MKKVLLVINKFMDIYQDIQTELERQGYSVTHVEDISYKNDPFLIREKKQSEEAYLLRETFYSNYWSNVISNSNSDFVFDYLFAVEGFSICKSLIEYLEQKNPQIKKCLYLYDKTYQNFQFDLNFKYFDKVFTFDRFDSNHYHIPLLPIYWVPTQQKEKTKYCIFGFASYQKRRYEIFKEINDKVKQLQKKSYIKVYVPYDKCNIFKKSLKYLRDLFSRQLLDHSLVSHKTLTPAEFRLKILESDIILDTHNSFQDGLTARFAWAIGLGKKIITTNEAAKEYEFYNPKGILIINRDTYIPDNFFTDEYIPTSNAVKAIEKFRIDNWIKTILS